LHDKNADEPIKYDEIITRVTYQSIKSAQVDPWAKSIEDGFTKEFNKIVINPEESHSFEAKEI
jgi:hypothetical protein